MTPLSFVPTSDFSDRAVTPAPRLPGHLAIPVILGMALASWFGVWKLVEAVVLLIDALV